MLPPQFGALANIQFIEFSRNDLQGPIPIEYSNLLNLRSLYLNNNPRMSNEIVPAALDDLPGLSVMVDTIIDVSDVVPVDDCVIVKKVLRKLGIWNIPNDCCAQRGRGFLIMCEWRRVTELHLVNIGHKSGVSIPAGIFTLTKLVALRLTKLKLTGVIPKELGNLFNLEFLVINNNPELTGNIPPSIGRLSKLDQL